MHAKHAPLISFLLVVGLHLGVLAAVMLTSSSPKPPEITQPTIQGVIVMAQPEVVQPPPEPLPPPPPEKKPEPKPTPKPLPKAPPSERAVQAPEPEPAPPPTVEKPAEPKPAQPAAIVPPREDAGQISNPAPVYPSLSRRLREEGTVVLEILIKANGSVSEIKLKTSSGFKRLDEAAIKAVQHWRYAPATQAGVAIDFWYEQPLEFNLH